MFLIFQTKRNANGHRHFLAIETTNARYSTAPGRMYYSREEYAEISTKDFRRMVASLDDSGFQCYATPID